MTTLHQVTLRDIRDDDLPVFFEQQRDPDASYMAAFTHRDPNDRAAFDAHWAKILADKNNINKTIVFEGQVAGNIASFPWDGKREVGYWIGKEYWGKGIGTQALSQFLQIVTERPLHAMVAHDNLGSQRVLAKCGFVEVGRGHFFANARGQDIEEIYLTLE